MNRSHIVTNAASYLWREYYDGRKVTTYTTHQWYVVLEVVCVVYVGIPPTTHVGGVKWYVVLEVFCVVYVGKPPTTHVGGAKWYVVLEVFCVVYMCISVNLQKHMLEV